MAHSWIANGIMAAPGRCIGKAIVMEDFSIRDSNIKNLKIAKAILANAIQVTISELTVIRAEMEETVGEDVAILFDFQIVIAEDETIQQDILSLMEHISLQEAIRKYFLRYQEELMCSSNAALRDRAYDMKDLQQRLLKNLLSSNGDLLPSPQEETIVIVKELYPSLIQEIKDKRIQGLICEEGSYQSHLSILARATQLPMLIQVREATRLIHTNDMIALNATEGQIIIHPSPDQIVSLLSSKSKKQRNPFDSSMTSLDHLHVMLKANCNTVEESMGLQSDIGLFRSEIDLDTYEIEEETLYQRYKNLLSHIAPKSVTVRTFDFQEDKIPTDWQNNSPEFFLELFRMQIRALIRASQYGCLSVMFPMVSTVNQFEALYQIYKEEKALLAPKLVLPNTIKIGLMIETVEAAENIHYFMENVDFISVGTNDLTRFLFNQKRDTSDPTLACHPKMLNLLSRIIETAHAHQCPVSVCGEAAADPIMAPLLVGLNVDELSMDPAAFPRIVTLLRSVSKNHLQLAAQRAKQANHPEQVEKIILDLIAEK